MKCQGRGIIEEVRGCERRREANSCRLAQDRRCRKQKAERGRTSERKERGREKERLSCSCFGKKSRQKRER